jgi:antitoxin FitA
MAPDRGPSRRRGRPLLNRRHRRRFWISNEGACGSASLSRAGTRFCISFVYLGPASCNKEQEIHPLPFSFRTGRTQPTSLTSPGFLTNLRPWVVPEGACRAGDREFDPRCSHHGTGRSNREASVSGVPVFVWAPAHAKTSLGKSYMTEMTIHLPEDTLARLREKASAYGVSPEELVRAGIDHLLDSLADEFETTADYVLEKNKEFYRRLACCDS